MYTIEQSVLFEQEIIQLINKNTGENLSVFPSFGGTIQALVLSKNGKVYDLICGNEDLASLEGKPINFYRGSKLCPFPNRIDKGKYIYKQKKYQLVINDTPHALHGLVWNKPFVVKEKYVETTFCRLVLTRTEESEQEGYPFKYTIEITYELSFEGFSCTTLIKNCDVSSIPIGDGWHPYFCIDKKIDHLKLILASSKLLEMRTDLIPNGNFKNDMRFISGSLLKDISLDHCFEFNESGIVETKLIDENQGVSIVVWQDTDQNAYRYVQLYTPPDRNSIAIEPISCAPNAFNNQMGLTILAPNEEMKCRFGVKIQ